MGWNSWNQVRCHSLTEQVVRDAADALVSTGMSDAGYRYVVVDDCWQAHARGRDGALRAHPERFPSGIKALADYVHDRGLKFGIYSSPGSATCAMHWDAYPGTALGSLGHERQDAETFAAWGVDYLKYDWCRADINDDLEPVSTFQRMQDALASVGRDIVYSISEYGAYQPWTWAHDVANLWRTTQDLWATWDSVSDVIESQACLADYTGRPEAWNDPDLLQVGNGTLTDEENRTHFSLWAILNAPLFASTDLTRLSEPTLRTLTNREVIAVDQDFAGTQGRRLTATGPLEVWGKQLGDGGYAVALYNRSDRHSVISARLRTLGLEPGDHGWLVRDLWAQHDLGRTHDSVSASVPEHGVALYRLKPADRPHGSPRS